MQDTVFPPVSSTGAGRCFTHCSLHSQRDADDLFHTSLAIQSVTL